MTRRGTVTEHTQALNRATIGLIADGATRFESTFLYERFDDQCERIGIYCLAWPTFAKLIKECGYLKFDTIDRIDLDITKEHLTLIKS